MIRAYSLIALAFSAATAEVPDRDLLLFTNDDSLHGSYQGISKDGRVLWQRADLREPMEITQAKIRQIVLRDGEPLQLLDSPSHIGLLNGDRFPGRIIQLTANELSLETEFAGTLTIPRNQVGLLAPQPFGGQLRYHGPHSPEGWEILPYPPLAELDRQAQEAAEPTEKTIEPEGWQLSNGAWYWTGKRTHATLARKNCLPERYILKFTIDWKSRLGVSFGFNANFEIPQSEGGEEERANANNPSMIFGNAHVLNIFSEYLMVFRSSFTEDGTPQFETVQTNHSNVRIGETGSAEVEIRYDQVSGEAAVFINGEFVIQWVDDQAQHLGNGVGFIVQQNESPTRISNLTIADWNGMPDAARSLQSQENDIILLTNGTDRFSGKVEEIREGKVFLKGPYANAQIPLTEVSEIHFARKQLAEPSKNTGYPTKLRLHPLGLLSVKLEPSPAEMLHLSHPVIGKITMKLDPISTIHFDPSASFLDAWIPPF